MPRRKRRPTTLIVGWVSPPGRNPPEHRQTCASAPPRPCLKQLRAQVERASLGRGASGQGFAQEAPRLHYRPDAGPHTRGPPCGRDSPAPLIHPSPRPANRGRQAFPEATTTVTSAVARRASMSPRGRRRKRSMWDTQHNRKPMLLFRLFGWLLLRLAARALS